MKIRTDFKINNFTRLDIPRVTVSCPACNSEISLTELIEKKGYVGCINCSK
ncbi:MAG: hypothetical protein QW818_03635 [Candidatus Aenigmatarchaeota archaeon]|nr:hypothetical protein [Candidatus Aenigmarchaeota archaeon]